MNGAADPTAWAQAMAALGAAGDRLVAEMAARGQSVDSSDVHATLLGALSDTYLSQIGVSPEHPSFVPCTGYFQRLGSPNPDTVYRSAPVDPAGTYRLTGTRGTALDVTLMPFTAMMQSSAPFDLSRVSHDAGGQFDVLVCAERPPDHAGDWWQLDPDTASLWLREVSDRWGEEEPARIAITRLDSCSRQRTSPAKAAAQLASLAMRVERIAEYGIRHADELEAQNFVNRLKEVDYSKSGAMSLQWYQEGLFNLSDDQGLLIEAHMPADCGYFSWSLTDRMLVTLDWMNAHTSLNRSQAEIDPDGVLRVVVSGKDPGVPNWLETMGYTMGVLQCRSIGPKSSPELSAKVIPLETVFDHLPKGTRRIGTDERLQRLRRRQAGCQMRCYW